MILSDRDIKARMAQGDIVITSPDDDHFDNIGASSMDLRLGKYFKSYNHSKYAILDPLNPESFKDVANLIEIDDQKSPFIVQPGEFVLGVTLEKIKIADDLVARVEGRSSLGRLGIIIHSTAGFVDAGFSRGFKLKRNQDCLVGENRNTMKSLRYYNLEDIDNAVLEDVIREAASLYK